MDTPVQYRLNVPRFEYNDLQILGREIGLAVVLSCREVERITTSSEASRLTFPLLFAALTGRWATVQLALQSKVNTIR